MFRWKVKPVLYWVAAMILCPLGVALCAKSGFGVSMIEAPVYVLHLFLHQFWSGFSFGTSEYVVQALLLIALCVYLRRFHPWYLLSFITAFLYGQVLDLWYLLIGAGTFVTMVGRIAGLAAGTLLNTLSVALFFRTWMPPEVWELVVKQIAGVKKFNITKVKWVYDISSLSVGMILMLVFFRTWRWDVVGVGSLVTTLVNAPLIAFFGRRLDRWFR